MLDPSLLAPSDDETPPLPPFAYSVALIDPPWRMNTYSDKGRARLPDGQGHYRTMSIPAIQALPIQDILERNALVFLWVTGWGLEIGIETLKGWGLSYRAIAFQWVKLNKSSESFFHGQGFYTKNNAEICLLGRNGKGLKRAAHGVEELIVAPLGRHSEKPGIVHERIETLLGDQSRIELFARQRRPGWRAWGLGVPKS